MAEDSPSVLSLGQLCDELRCTYSWRPPLVAVTQQKVTPSIRHDPSRGSPVPDTEVEETTHNVLELSSESLIDDDAALVRETSPAEKGSQALLQKTVPPSVITDAGGDRLAEDKKATADCTKGANDSQPRGDHNVFTHLSRDPTCEEDDTDHTRQMQKLTSETRRWDPTSHHIRRAVTAEHKSMNVDDEPRNDHRNDLIVQDGNSSWLQSYLTKKAKTHNKQHRF